jgi:hypothetical protein
MHDRNPYADARRRWEEEQERLHGCQYKDGQCIVHGSTSLTASESTRQESQLLCTCRSFSYPHPPQEHDALAARFLGDTELKRFQDAAPADWRTPEERQLQDNQLWLVDETRDASDQGQNTRTNTAGKGNRPKIRT